MIDRKIEAIDEATGDRQCKEFFKILLSTNQEVFNGK